MKPNKKNTVKTPKFDIKEHRFKPFHETYKRITFALSIGLMFPNPATARFRIISIVSVIITYMPLNALIIINIWRCWVERDVFNLIRHSTVIGPVLGAFFKMLLMYYKRVPAKEIIDEINRDHALFNGLPPHHQTLAYYAIENSIFYSEKLWSVIVTAGILAFPGVACVLTIYSQLFDEEPTKYMVHEVFIPFLDQEKILFSPCYELIAIYMTISAWICVFNYVSYDGYFGLATNHACLKMNMACEMLDYVFQKNEADMYGAVVKFVEEQKRLYRFIELIQDTFNIWLGTIFASTMIELGSLLYHISSGYGFDFKYTLFSITAVVHIFLPCKYAANLKSTATQISTRVYCSGWERASDPRIRRVVPFLIARAQIPSHITCLNMLVFDMELFVFLMRTSYTMFTLIRS